MNGEIIRNFKVPVFGVGEPLSETRMNSLLCCKIIGDEKSGLADDQAKLVLVEFGLRRTNGGVKVVI